MPTFCFISDEVQSEGQDPQDQDKWLNNMGNLGYNHLKMKLEKKLTKKDVQQAKKMLKKGKYISLGGYSN